ncbi:MAG: hypothetical protein L6V82_00265 [Clostridiales bacterium]|nr:MAG: hypothetical protein L6V82_00265 [Clostridiales bacterium]
MIDGLVIKGVASRYKVDTADGIITSYARGKLKIDGEIRVGDKVGVEKQGKDFVIAKVYERKRADTPVRRERGRVFYRNRARARARLYAG